MMALTNTNIIYIYQGCNQFTQIQSISDTFGPRFTTNSKITKAYFTNS